MLFENVNEASEDGIYRIAEQNRVYDAEKNITHIRTGIIFFNIIAYYFFLDKTYALPSLVMAVSIVAGAYTLFVEIAKPYQKYPVFLTGYFTALTDGLLISYWLLATGGYHSPFFVLWYVSIIAVAFRFASITTTIFSLLYGLCYFLVSYFGPHEGFGEIAPDLTIRIAYIVFAGFLGTLITRENFSKTRQKVELELLTHKIKEINEQLSFQTSLYQNMLQAQSELGEGVAIVINNKLAHVNEALCKLSGYNKEELLALESVMDLVAPEERQRVQETETRRWRGEAMEGYLETVLAGKKGEKISIGLSSKVFEMNNQRSLFYIIRDISEQRRKDLQLEAKTKDLILQNQELEQFSYFVSHDLLEPLRMVNSFLNLLEKKYESQLDETAHQYISYATDGAMRMRKTILDLLEYSRVGTREYERDTINVNDVMQEVVQLYRTNIEENNARVNWEKLPVIDGGRTHIQLVLQNLVDNALKYRAGQANVTVSHTETKTHWQFSVTDNGIGIDPRFFDRIFILFQRLHQRDEYSGTGVGLAICKKIVEKHGGRIWVESKPGEGSVFYFTISK
jgi:PAS domain S-box-containing protein